MYLLPLPPDVNKLHLLLYMVCDLSGFFGESEIDEDAVDTGFDQFSFDWFWRCQPDFLSAFHLYFPPGQHHKPL